MITKTKQKTNTKGRNHCFAGRNMLDAIIENVIIKICHSNKSHALQQRLLEKKKQKFQVVILWNHNIKE